MTGLWQDVRYATRKLVRQPGFTVAAVLTLALGMGANAVLFTLVNALLLRPPAGVRAPEQLVAIYTADYSGRALGTSSYPDFEEFAKQTDVFDGAVLFAPLMTAFGDVENARPIGMELVSPNYFNVLGTRVRGRSFAADEIATGAAVAVVSDAFWRQQMFGATDAIGRQIRLNGRLVTVIGITEPEFRGTVRGFSTSAWVPAHSSAAIGMGSYGVNERGSKSYMVWGRLRPGMTAERAQVRMQLLAQQLFQAYPDNWVHISGGARSITVRPESHSRIMPQVSGPAYAITTLLSAIVAIVLLICCANVAGLMVARATSLKREMGIRLSIGASRARLVRMLIIESLLLASFAAALGLVVSTWAIDGLLTFLPRIPASLGLDLSVDGRVLLFTGGVAVTSALLFGLAPALRASRADLSSVIKDGAASAPVGRRRISLRSVLVGAQVAASVLLLVTALVFLRSMRSVTTTNLGFATENMALYDLSPEPGYDPTSEEGLQTATAVVAALERIPGVLKATWSNAAPLELSANRRSTRIIGHERAENEDTEFHYMQVGPSYPTTLGMQLTEGRDLTAQDRAGAEPVVVVNEAFAKRFWPNESALGKRISTWDTVNTHRIVGVVRNAALVNLAESYKPYIFWPALQLGWEGTTLHIRMKDASSANLIAIRDVLKREAPRWSARAERTMDRQVANSMLTQRIASGVLTLFGAVAVLLAAIGLYGVIAYAVGQRTHEFGIRFALGATSRDVLNLMLGQGLRVVVTGAIVGLVLAAGATMALQSLLLGMGPIDPVSFLAAPLLLIVIGLVATLLPARRASRLDPVKALHTGF